MSEWVSVEDRLPNKDQLCVTMFSEVKNPDRPYLYLREHFEAGRGLQSFGSRKAVCWMPLPEPPK
jgi:hypothetical protein